MEVDQQVQVICLVPIDYGGGQCRLFRDGSLRPIRTRRADYFVCRFVLPAKELLGLRPVGSIILFRCDYQLQQYTSALSDLAGVTVQGESWSRKPSTGPGLRVLPQGFGSKSDLGPGLIQCSFS